MTATIPIPVTVRWYAREEGGRAKPPDGPKYATTGRFSGQEPQEMFSVVLVIPRSVPATGDFETTGQLSPLFPENVPDFADRFARGEKFILHEGRRAIAECTIAAPGA
jgi:hypothetical protein